MELEDDQIGFAKYEGDLVADGYLDARKSAQALIGFDEAVRFYMYKQDPELKELEFEFPVRVQKGSWTILIGALTIIGTAYGVKAAQKMAENDFENVGLLDILKKSLSAMQWVLRIGKHLGDIRIKKFEHVEFKDDNKLIGIPNSEGEVLFVPKEFLDLYAATNPTLLKKMSEIVEDQRSLTIGVREKEVVVEETLTRRHRRIFTSEEETEEERILPELVHGEKVVLDAEVTRGNETSNTIGIKYSDHIITGFPEHGSIVRFKPSLFLKCRVYGEITREHFGTQDAKRPKIIVSRLESLDEEVKESDLFESNTDELRGH